MGKICIERIDPGTIFWDPMAKQLHWNYMDYVIQAHEMESGELRKQYPFTAFNVPVDTNNLMAPNSVDMKNNTDYIQSPQPKLARDTAMNRQKIQVLECWLKDSRLKFEPTPNLESAGWDDRFQIDKSGNLIGRWVPRYPNGRLIVVAAGHVLKDVPNPYAHGQCPFIFFKASPSKKPDTLGDASRIMVVTRKINDVLKHVHAYAQSEIERPMHSDAGAIINPDLRDNVPSTSNYIVELVQGKKLDRRPPQDIPPFTWTYLQSLQAALDLISGSSAVMRGNLADGAQVSAEALQALQQYASSRLSQAAQFFNVGIKQLGRQIMWLIRQSYDQKIKIQVTLPDGTTESFDWESDRLVFEKGDPTEIDRLRATEDYLVMIKPGSGAPGGKQQQTSSLLELFRENAIDREALLDGMEFPNRQVMLQRMRNKELEDIKTKAEAKELGVSMSDQIKQLRAGRRPKE
jgi:hypothetical protein